MEKLLKQHRKANILTASDSQPTTAGNSNTQDTYEWYVEEAYSRELTNDEVLRMNELGLIKEGWDPAAAHKKVYC